MNETVSAEQLAAFEGLLANYPDVHCADPAALLYKVNTFREEMTREKDPVGIICKADFDGTTTIAGGRDRMYMTSYGVLKRILGGEYESGATALYQTYHPYELDKSYPLRQEKITEWFDKSIQLLMDSGFNRKIIKEVFKGGHIQLREGVAEFFSTLLNKDVPVWMVSAGLGNIIEVCTDIWGLKDRVRIHANMIEFENEEDESPSKRLKGDIVTSINKRQTLMLNPEFTTESTGRTNVILLGDTEDDIDMLEPYEKSIKIGFLNDPDDQSLERYKEIYDIVITNREGLRFGNEVLLPMLFG